MRMALMIALLVPATAWSAPASPKDPAVKEKLLLLIDVIVAKSAEYNGQMDVENKLRIALHENKNTELLIKWDKAERLRRKLESELHSAFWDAREQIGQAYGVEPEGKKHFLGTAIKIKKGPLAGTMAHWSPGLVFKSAVLEGEAELFSSAKSLKGEWHQFGGSFKPDDLGLTLPNGAVGIRLEALVQAHKQRNPGILAYLIHHEAAHFKHLETEGWDSIEAAEVYAYGESLKAMDAFEFSSPSSAKSFFESKINDNTALVKSGNTTPGFPTPQKELQIKEFLDQRGKLWNKLNEDRDSLFALVPEAKRQHHLGTLSAIVTRVCAGPTTITSGEIAEMNEQPASFYQGLSADGVGSLESCHRYVYGKLLDVLKENKVPGPGWAEGTARNYEELRAREKLNAQMARVAQEAERCGFKAKTSDQGLKGFTINQDEYQNLYTFPNKMDVEGFQVNLMFARLCDNARRTDAIEEPPCNDGLDIINKRWNDQTFRDQIGVEPYAPITNCVSHLAENIRLPVKIKAIKRLAKNVVDDYERRQEEARERNRKEERKREKQKERKKNERDGGDRESGGGKPGCDWQPDIGKNCPAYGP